MAVGKNLGVDSPVRPWPIQRYRTGPNVQAASWPRQQRSGVVGDGGGGDRSGRAFNGGRR
jgi:hypothetical protein